MIFLHVVDEQVVEELASTSNGDGRAQQVREQLRENGQMYLRDAARFADECRRRAPRD